MVQPPALAEGDVFKLTVDAQLLGHQILFLCWKSWAGTCLWTDTDKSASDPRAAPPARRPLRRDRAGGNNAGAVRLGWFRGPIGRPRSHACSAASRCPMSNDHPIETAEYEGPVGGWGSMKGMASIARIAKSRPSAMETLRSQNKPGGYMCSSCAWAKPAEPAPVRVLRERRQGDALGPDHAPLHAGVLRRSTRVTELRTLVGPRSREAGPADRIRCATTPPRDRYVPCRAGTRPSPTSAPS